MIHRRIGERQLGINMINRKQIEQDIVSQKQLEIILPQALTMISSDYFTYSALQFTMNFYNYYEMTTKHEMSGIDTSFFMIDDIAKKTIFASFDGKKREEAISQIDSIREEVIDVMQELTELADRFSIYEYILNRIEKNFDQNLVDVDNDVVSKEIMQRIFADQDQLLINTRIRSMLSQLPIRMTRTRFFDMLRDSLSIYEGSDKSSVCDYLYMLLSASGLTNLNVDHQKEEKNQVMKDLYNQLHFFEQLNWTSMSEEELKNAQNVLTLAVEQIKDSTDRYYSLQEVINAFYCMLLNQPYALAEAEGKVQPLKEIMLAISQSIAENKKESLSEAIVDMFEYTEGLLEQYVQYISKDESILEGIDKSNQVLIDSLMLTNQVTSLSLSKSLTSNSIFIDLHAKVEESKADKNFINLKYEEIVTIFSKALESKNKLYHRSMIAAALREMPVLFHTVEEVRDYVRGSLSGCHDIAEKVASVELFMAAIE